MNTAYAQDSTNGSTDRSRDSCGSNRDSSTATMIELDRRPMCTPPLVPEFRDDRMEVLTTTLAMMADDMDVVNESNDAAAGGSASARHGRNNDSMSDDDDDGSSNSQDLPLHEIVPHWPPKDDGEYDPIYIPWDMVADRCLSHPHELTVSYEDYYQKNDLMCMVQPNDRRLDERFVLHAILQRDPPESVVNIALHAMIRFNETRRMSGRPNGTSDGSAMGGPSFASLLQTARVYGAPASALRFISDAANGR